MSGSTTTSEIPRHLADELMSRPDAPPATRSEFWLDLVGWLALLDEALAVHELPLGLLHGPSADGSYRVDTLVDEAADEWLMEGDVVVAIGGDRAVVAVVGEADHEHPDRLGGLLLPVGHPVSVGDVVSTARRVRG